MTSHIRRHKICQTAFRMVAIEAYQMAEQINLKSISGRILAQPLIANSNELYYRMENNHALYVLNYGVVVFAGYSEEEKKETLLSIKSCCKNLEIIPYQEDFNAAEDSNLSKPVFSNNAVRVPKLNEEVLYMVMLNIGQSVALDRYEELTSDILEKTQQLTAQMEYRGRLRASKSSLLKFIGRTMNIKNGIAENLYIMDYPGVVWENEFLDQINKGLKKIFDIQNRFKDIDYKLQIVQNNLKLFTDILQHKESSRLEWIIIILILIEVINVFVNEFLL